MGLRKGDRVGIWGPNSYEWYATFLAAMKSGLILVSLEITNWVFEWLEFQCTIIM